MRSWQKAIGSLFLAGILAVPAFSQAGSRGPAQPGTLNYVEGQASIDSTPLNPNSVGTVIQAGQTISTQNGKAELLLTPGVFLRVDSNSAVRMDSPDLVNTVLTVQRGRAIVEAGQILPANNIVINENGASVKLDKKGLYEFDANQNAVRVFDGEIRVMVNNNEYRVTGGHELALNAGKLKARGFDKKTAQDDFYRWASLRASYLAEANVDAARTYVGGGYGWYGSGWYWDPWFSAYTWIPGDGLFWSPFGWGFYSPFVVGYAPFYGFGYRGAYFHHFGPGYRAPVFAGNRGVAHGFASPGVRGGFSGSMRGGGFSGGFHGGGGHR
jgi:hypothetical protein